MLLSTLKWEAPLQQRVLQPKKTAVPLVRYSDRSCYHYHLTDIPSMITRYYKETLLGLMTMQNSISPSFPLCSIWWPMAVAWAQRKMGTGVRSEKVYRFGVHAAHKTNFCWTWMKIIKERLRGRWQKARNSQPENLCMAEQEASGAKWKSCRKTHRVGLIWSAGHLSIDSQ